ncbi:phospholipase C, phosphocholine-specific, partial [Frankia sp. CNm7]
MTPRISRRAALGGMAAGAAASLLPPSLLEAMAITPPSGGLGAVEHVIVLMQENRSFDNYFGRLKGVRGFGDRVPPRLPDGRSVLEQPRAGGGAVLPFSAREAAAAAGRATTDIEYLASLPHGWRDATQAWAQGWWNDWVQAKTASSMAFYDRQDIPLQYELAERFTICDAYFCSVYGSTNPNRNYLWSGKIGNEPGSSARAVTNAAYDYAHAGYDWTTYPERLTAAGISWQIYQEWDNFTDNAVEYFKPFKAVGTKVLAPLVARMDDIRAALGVTRDQLPDPVTTEMMYDGLNGLNLPAPLLQQVLALVQTGVDALGEQEREYFHRAMYRSAPGTLVQRLRDDIARGTLPKVSWLVPPAADSEHPGSSTPVGSANLIYDVLDAIAFKPTIWAKTVLFLNFDENDGYFDHVPAPSAPRPASGNGDDWYDGKPVGLGPRVPMTIVSPWTVGGFVASEVFDHTSVIQFLERWTGVTEPNISAWRRAVCGDLTSAFDFQRAHPRPRVAQPGPVPAAIGRWRPEPPASQAPPAQEPGTRPTRPLPYGLAVTASTTGTAVEFELVNKGTAAATVAGYPAGGGLPATWTVPANGRAAATLTHAAGGRYDIRLHGAGWSTWALRGTGVTVEAAFQEEADDGEVLVTVSNPSRETRALLVGESVYTRATGHGDQFASLRLRPGQRARVPVKVASHGWYDVVVLDAADPGYLRRATGRLARSGVGVTDPATGLLPVLTAELAAGVLVAGQAAEVTVTVTNTGNAKATDLAVGLLLPAGWTAKRSGA